MDLKLELDFREAMSRVPSPVTIVTTMVDGVPHGTTVSAFSSLSVNPPMVVLALDNRGSMIQHLRQAGRMGVTVLSAAQAQLAVRFASKQVEDRFDGIEWATTDGVPQLAGAAAFVRCDEISFGPGGDHTIVLGTVADVQVGDADSLTYYRRRFGSALAGSEALTS